MSKKPTLNHLAIIPDGNRRWAKQHGLTGQKEIYQQGSDKTFEIIQAALEYDVPHVTFWASSYANLAERPTGFAKAMERMYAQKFRELAEHPLIHNNKVHVEIRGQWRELLGKDAQAALQGAIDTTADYHDRQLTILVGYDGRTERGAAVEAMLKDHEAGIINLPSDAKNADKLLRSYAWTGYLPDVDLIVRTGAWKDPHNSAAFLSLLTSESQFAFPEVLWPDFTAPMLHDLLDDFLGRERRMGR